jgi:hypothetical protein
MQMVRLAVAGKYLAVHLAEDVAGMFLKPFQRAGVEYFPAVFGHADQMRGKS